jgi:carbon-monoxide dehydrogenase small subunit/xanthine dehydrogenase YagT iron-sulfur-binding subunit
MSDPKRPDDARLSRRSLMKGAGAAAAASALLRPFEALAEEGAGAVRRTGPGASAFSLTLNGKKRELRAEPRQTLLEVLRDASVGLSGTKPACDRAQCGACTVWLDGEPVPACSVLAVETEGHEVTTVEGLGSPDALHPVQRAFVAEDAAQCGFCTSGMVMSVAWAVKTHGKDLAADQVREACAGNLCRCGTYPHVVQAALRAAKES